MKPKVFLTRRVPEEVMRALRERTELRMPRETWAPDRDELIAGVRGVDGLLNMVTDTVDAEVMDAAGGLKVISNYAVGYDNIDLAAAAERGIVVTHTPGVLTETTADLAFALLLGAARRLVEGDAMVRCGTWDGWAPTQLLGVDVFGATLGIVGFGRIGRAVARRAKGFNMRVLYWDRERADDEDAAAIGAEFTELDDLLRESDFVSLHVSLNDETRHLLDAERLGRMKPTAVLINTARGPVVDEAALIDALHAGRLAAAGLDVYENEPAVPRGLMGLPNVLLLPHLGSATVATRTKMGLMAVENLLAACEGRTPPHVVA